MLKNMEAASYILMVYRPTCKSLKYVGYQHPDDPFPTFPLFCLN